MQFLLSAVGSAGDVHPFIAIAQALLGRGHEVRIVALPPFESRIRRAGIEFTPIGTQADYDRLVEQSDLWHPRRGARLLVDELLDRLPEAYDCIAALTIPGKTVLVGSSLSWGVRLVQEKLGVRAATLHLSPMCLQSATAPAVLPFAGDLSWLPAWSMRLIQGAAEGLVIDRVVSPRLNRVRAGLGLPPVDRIWSTWMHSPDLVIAAWPDWFAPKQPDWPPQTVTTGFPSFDETDAGLDPGLETFLANGERPVGITPGSAMAHGRDFLAKAIEACDASGLRAVVATPYRHQLPDRLTDSVHHSPYVPFHRLLPRLTALIHHGGIGTSAAALAAGVPQLVVPFAYDQFDNAARLGRLDCSLTLKTTSGRADWTQAVHRLVTGSTIRESATRAQARMMTSVPASEMIAARLERLGS
ncbi:glycosyltransferase [soil metagenome]